MSDTNRAKACASCGALNDGTFGKCIRCGRSLSAGPVAAGPIEPSSFPATKVICVMALVVFAGQMMTALAHGKGIPILGSGAPADDLRFGALPERPDLALAQPWRLLSAVFVHFGVVHILLNLSALANLARFAEPAIGSARFVVAYVATGIAGFATTIAYETFFGSPLLSENAMTAGASGAIFGVMGLILGWLGRRRDPRWKDFAVQAVFYIAMFAILNATQRGIQINNSAHAGGLVVGVVFGWLYAGREAGHSPMWANVAAVVGLLASVASVVLCRLVPLWPVL